MLTLKKPSGGIPPNKIDHIVGKKLNKDASSNFLLRIEDISNILVNSLSKGNTIFWCGNGGSAGDSQHLAAELIGRYKNDRKPLKSIALTTDSSALTAISNDYGFENDE